MFDFSTLNESAQQETPFTPQKRERGDVKKLCDGQPRHIDERFYINDGSFGKYATFTVAEDSGHRFYGSKAITEQLMRVQQAGAAVELPQQEVYFELHDYTAANGDPRSYVTIRFA